MTNRTEAAYKIPRYLLVYTLDANSPEISAYLISDVDPVNLEKRVFNYGHLGLTGLVAEWLGLDKPVDWAEMTFLDDDGACGLECGDLPTLTYWRREIDVYC